MTTTEQALEMAAGLVEALGEGWRLGDRDRGPDRDRWVWIHGPEGQHAHWYAGSPEKLGVKGAGGRESTLALEAGTPLAQRVRRALARAARARDENARLVEQNKAEQAALDARLAGVAEELAALGVQTSTEKYGRHLEVEGPGELRVYAPEQGGALVLQDSYHPLGKGTAEQVARAVLALAELNTTEGGADGS